MIPNVDFRYATFCLVRHFKKLGFKLVIFHQSTSTLDYEGLTRLGEILKFRKFSGATAGINGLRLKGGMSAAEFFATSILRFSKPKA
uniref:Uncharacterized protein n=1 Tax=Romanomermis culicivorax TaxID=13658 RepID=A0A915JXR1_ROMCU